MMIIELLQLNQRIDLQGTTLQGLVTRNQSNTLFHAENHSNGFDFDDQLYRGNVRLSGNNQFEVELVDVRERLQALSASTTNACKSLSAGLRDVQKAIVGFYKWADAVHYGLDDITQVVEMDNPVPRLKLLTDRRTDR